MTPERLVAKSGFGGGSLLSRLQRREPLADAAGERRGISSCQASSHIIGSSTVIPEHWRRRAAKRSFKAGTAMGKREGVRPAAAARCWKAAGCLVV
jgi:hypothetical protein